MFKKNTSVRVPSEDTIFNPSQSSKKQTWCSWTYQNVSWTWSIHERRVCIGCAGDLKSGDFKRRLLAVVGIEGRWASEFICPHLLMPMLNMHDNMPPRSRGREILYNTHFSIPVKTWNKKKTFLKYPLFYYFHNNVILEGLYTKKPMEQVFVSELYWTIKITAKQIRSTRRRITFDLKTFD